MYVMSASICIHVGAAGCSYNFNCSLLYTCTTDRTAECLLISPSYVHRLILISHTLCIQETAETTGAQLPHTGDAELTTPQEDIADRETTTVSALHTIV